MFPLGLLQPVASHRAVFDHTWRGGCTSLPFRRKGPEWTSSGLALCYMHECQWRVWIHFMRKKAIQRVVYYALYWRRWASSKWVCTVVCLCTCILCTCSCLYAQTRHHLCVLPCSRVRCCRVVFCIEEHTVPESNGATLKAYQKLNLRPRRGSSTNTFIYLISEIINICNVFLKK